MPEFTPYPRAELERMAREAYRRAYPDGGRARPEPAVQNAHSVLVSLGTEALWLRYGGRLWELQPISFADGVWLSEARSAVVAVEDEDQLTPEKVRAYHTALREVVRMAPRYLKPAGLLRRVLWHLRIRRNPYRRATEWEVGQLLGFFWGCRMMSRGRFPAT